MGRLKQVGVRALSSLLAAPPPPQTAHQSFQPVRVEELNRAPPRHSDEPLFHQLAKRPRHGFYRQPAAIRYLGSSPPQVERTLIPTPTPVATSPRGEQARHSFFED